MAHTMRSGRTRLTREERREQIVAAAAEVFSGRDPATVTFEEIADAAGVSRALVYNYFGDRNGLLEAVYVRASAELNSRVASALASDGDRRAVLRRAVEAHVSYASTDPAGYRYAAGGTSFARLPAFHASRIRSTARNLGDTDEADTIATAVLAVLHSCVVHWLDQPSIDAGRLAEVLTAFLGGGLDEVRHAAVLASGPEVPTAAVRAPRRRSGRRSIA